MEAFEILTSRVAGADARDRAPLEARGGPRGLRAVGAGDRGHRRRSSRAARSRSAHEGEVVARCRPPRSPTTAPSTTGRWRPGDVGATDEIPRSCRSRATCARRSSTVLVLAERREQAVDLRAVRLDRPGPDRRGVGLGRRRRARARHVEGARARRATARAGSGTSIRTSGAMHAVAEAARNVAVTGAKPLAITNCMNFGNPERPVVMWQFAESIRGHARRLLSARRRRSPAATSASTTSRATRRSGPTPVIGMLGLLEDYRLRVPTAFPRAGLAIYLLGETFAELGGSEFADAVLGVVAGQSTGARSRTASAPCTTCCTKAARSDCARQRARLRRRRTGDHARRSRDR